MKSAIADHLYPHHQRGITLINIAVILVIISILMVPFFQMNHLVQKRDTRAKQFGTVGKVAQALIAYAQKNGAYPLPADPSMNIYTGGNNAGKPLSQLAVYNYLAWPPQLPMGTAQNNFWKKCNTGGAYVANNGGGAGGVSTIPASYNTRILCTRWSGSSPYGPYGVIGASNPYGDPNNGSGGNPLKFPADSSLNPAQALADEKSINNFDFIGAVPYDVLGLTPEESLDEYGRKLKYAVTYGLTKPETFNDSYGTLMFYDSKTISTCPAGIAYQAIGTDYPGGIPVCTGPKSRAQPAGSANTKLHFVVVSLGQDGAGAYLPTGAQPIPCGSSASATVAGRRATNAYQDPTTLLGYPAISEGENCDDSNGGFRVLTDDDTNYPTQRYNLYNGLVRDSTGDYVNPYFDDSLAWTNTIYGGQSTGRALTKGAQCWSQDGSCIWPQYGTVSYPLYQTYLWRGLPVWLGSGTLKNLTTVPEAGQLQILGTSNNLKSNSVAAPLICGGATTDRASGCFNPQVFTTTTATGRNSFLPLMSVGPSGTNTTTCMATSPCTPVEGRVSPGMENVVAGYNGPLGKPSPTTAAANLDTSGVCKYGVCGLKTDGTLICNDGTSSCH